MAPMDPDDYKVSRLLKPLMEKAMREQTGANISVDCRLYFRHDPGDKKLKGEVAFLDYDTKQLVKITSTSEDSLVLDGEDAMYWFLERIAEHGFELVSKRIPTLKPKP